MHKLNNRYISIATSFSFFFMTSSSLFDSIMVGLFLWNVYSFYAGFLGLEWGIARFCNWRPEFVLFLMVEPGWIFLLCLKVWEKKTVILRYTNCLASKFQRKHAQPKMVTQGINMKNLIGRFPFRTPSHLLSFQEIMSCFLKIYEKFFKNFNKSVKHN